MLKNIIMKCLYCILFIFSFLGCENSENEERVYIVNMDEAQKDDLHSMYEHVAYVPLETTEDNEIGKINQILYYDGKYLVVDGLTNQVFIFTDAGKLFSKIESIGNGPGEYVQITDITINKQEEKIKILDGMQGKIVTFDLNGHFVNETKLPVSPSPMRFCQVGEYKYAFDFQRHFLDKEWQYSLCISKEDLSGEVSKFFPYDTPLNISFSPKVTLQDVNGEIIYVPLYNSTVYTIDPSGIKPRYTFDFGDKWVSQEFIDIQWTDFVKYLNALDNATFVYYFNTLESGSHIYAEFMYKNKKYHLVIDKETDHLILQQEAEADKRPYSNMPVCCIGNKFVVPVTPSDYNTIVGENAAQLPEDNNPMLKLVTFKKF